MSQMMVSILEGFKQGQWHWVKPYHFTPQYTEALPIIDALKPLHAKLADLKAQGYSEEDPLYMPLYLDLYEQSTPKERQLEALTIALAYQYEDAFAHADYELQAILDIYWDTSIRACENYQKLEHDLGLPLDASQATLDYFDWIALDDCFDNVNLMPDARKNLDIRCLNVRDLLKFDWKQKIKRYCFVRPEISSLFGDGNKLFSHQQLMDLYVEDKLFFAASSRLDNYVCVTFYSTYLDAVGGDYFQQRLKQFQKYFSVYPKQRVIFYAF